MDASGRLVIPKEVRREARIAPGAPLTVRWHAGRIEIEPAPAPVRLERRGRLLVAVPLGAMPPLGLDTVEQTREQLLEDRAGSRPAPRAKTKRA
jgi:AbrB family looped-hinge helix DNA binding protein